MAMKRIYLLLSLLVFAVVANAQFRPDDLGGLSLWLRSDTLMTVSATEKVESWGDAAGSADGATQTGSSLQPLLVQDVFAGYPAVRFDGFNDFMLFPERSDIYTVFIVACETDAATHNFRSVLGHSSSYHFLRGGAEEIWHIDFVSPGITSGSTRLNFSEVDGTSTTFPYEPALLSVSSTEPLAANQLSVDRGFYSRVWQGDWFELIVYDWVLSETEIADVENYLADRYMPSFVALEPVSNPSLCDTTICVPEGFAQYLWNGVAGDPCYTATDAGDVVLQVVDGFGRITEQTIPVTFPGNNTTGQISICAGQSTTLESGMDAAEYDLSWTGGSSESALEVDVSGSYFYTATDDLGCSVERGPWVVQVNDFGLTNALEDSVHLCSGQLITPMNVQLSEVEAIWNETLTDSVLLAESSAWNYLQLTDAQGCILIDSTYANVLGQAPVVHADVLAGCQGDYVLFTEDAFTDSPISAWEWTVDGQTLVSESADLSVQIGSWGDLPFTLWVESEAGCEAVLDSTFTVKPTPSVALAVPQLCEYSNFAITPLVDLPQGEVSQIFWDQDGVLLAQDVFLGSVEQADSLELSVEVVSDAGCSVSLDTTLFFLTAPNPTFNTSSPHCEGEVFSFNGFTNCPDCPLDLIYNWDFDDGTFSSQEDPDHFYVSAGQYEVTFQVATPEGCQNSWTNTVGVFSPPDDIGISFELGCSGIPVTFYDQTPSATGNYGWVINGEALGSGWSSSVEYTFDEPGSYAVSHQAGTSGCVASEDFVIEIVQGANPDFLILPVAPPLGFQFYPEQQDGAHTWQWDGGDISVEESPLVTFEEGSHLIAHTVVNENNCPAASEVEWEAVEIETNIAVAGVFTTFGPAGGLLVQALVVNTGNHAISAIALQANTETDAGFWEWHAITLEAGAHAYVSLNGEIPLYTQGLVCVHARLEVPLLVEWNLEDNQWCESLGESTWSLPYPNPASGGFYLDVFLEDYASDISVHLIDAAGRDAEIWQGDLEPGYQHMWMAAPQLAGGLYQLVIYKAGEVIEQHAVTLIQSGN